MINYSPMNSGNNIYTDKGTAGYYSRNSKDLAERYADADVIHNSMLKKWVTMGADILDIGCGSGRDLAELQNSGFSVFGVDASKEMISAAVNRYPELKGKISISRLPTLYGIEENFDGILCSAVLQHIPDSGLYENFRRIKELLKNNGIFIISFPVKYPGVDSKTNRETKGRLFHIRSAEKYQSLIEKSGFTLLESLVQEDSLGRDKVKWGVQVWRNGGV